MRVARGGVREELLERDRGVGERARYARVVMREPRSLDRNAHHPEGDCYRNTRMSSAVIVVCPAHRCAESGGVRVRILLGYWHAGPPAHAWDVVAEADRPSLDSVWSA